MCGLHWWLASCRGWRKILFLTFHLRRILGVAHGFPIWRVALHCSPRMGRWTHGGFVWCVLGHYAGCWHVFEEAPPFPHLHLFTGYTLPGNAINSPYFSSQDRKTNGHVLKVHAAQGAQSPGCHSSLSGSPVTMTTPLMQVVMEHSLTWTRL